MKVRTVSEFGLVRDREYTSARDVAEGIVSCFDCCNEETYDKIADVRISGKSACIVITTKAHMVRMKLSALKTIYCSQVDNHCD